MKIHPAGITGPILMTDQIKKHPNQRGDLPRERFRCWAEHSTIERLKHWEKHPSALSRGDVVDKLVRHAAVTGFVPVDTIPPLAPLSATPATKPKGKARKYNE